MADDEARVQELKGKIIPILEAIEPITRPYQSLVRKGYIPGKIGDSRDFRRSGRHGEDGRLFYDESDGL